MKADIAARTIFETRLFRCRPYSPLAIAGGQGCQVPVKEKPSAGEAKQLSLGPLLAELFHQGMPELAPGLDKSLIHGGHHRAIKSFPCGRG